MRRYCRLWQSAIAGFAIIFPLLLAVLAEWSVKTNLDYRKAFELWRYSTSSATPQESTKDIVTYRIPIADTAKAFQVDPLTIAGVIYTEETLNRNPAKYFEDYYVRTYLLSSSENDLQRQLEQTKNELQLHKAEHEGWNLRFRSSHPLTWSIGLGRVSPLTALELEDELHIYEHRKRRNITSVLEALLNPQENLRYCAFELRRNALIYRELTGYDIRDRADLQASLYNLGQVRFVAERTLRERRQPLPNAFGVYAQTHLGEVRRALYSSQGQ